MTSWDPSITGADAFDLLHRTLTTNGAPTPYIPEWLKERLVSGHDGWQIITDPTVGSTYMCKSFWDDHISDAPLFESCETGEDPFLLFGIYPSNFHTYLAFALRYDDFAVFLMCHRKDDVLEFVTRVSQFLSNHCSTPKMRQLRHATFAIGRSNLHVGFKSDEDSPSDFGLFTSSGWKTLIDTGDAAKGREALDALMSSDQECHTSIRHLTTHLFPVEVKVPPQPAEVEPAKTEVPQASPEPPDPGKSFYVSPEFTQFISWALMTDILRRHSKKVDLYIDLYPTGSPMLSLVNKTRTRWVNLNNQGSLHFFNKRGFVWDSFMPWHQLVTEGTSEISHIIERHLQVPENSKPDKTDRRLIGPRAITAFLGMMLMSRKHWEVQPIYRRAGGLPGAANIVRKLDELANLEHEEDDVFKPKAWLVCDHQQVVRMVVSRNGMLATEKSGPKDLLDLYTSSGKNLARVAATFLD